MRPTIPESEIRKDSVYMMSLSQFTIVPSVVLCYHVSWMSRSLSLAKSLCELPARKNWTSAHPKTETWHCPMVPVWIYEVINMLWVSTFSLDTKPLALMKDGTKLYRLYPRKKHNIIQVDSSTGYWNWERQTGWQNWFLRVNTRAKVIWSLII